MTEVGAPYRDQFPVLGECVYLNSNSTGAYPSGMETALQRYWLTLRRWRDEAWGDWLRELETYRERLGVLIGADAQSIVTDASVSSLLGRLATCWRFEGSRRRIVISDLEFPSIEFIFRAFERVGAEVVVVPSEDGVQVDEQALCESIDDRTRLVCVSHGTFASGALVDVRRVARHAHSVGALVAVDAYQTIGVVPVDVRTLEVDFLLGGAHKWLCGAPDLGFLYVRPELARTLRPLATGWFASDAPLSFERVAKFARGAQRFASGTPSVLPAVASLPGLELIHAVGVPSIRRRSLQMTDRIIDWADDLGIPVATPRTHARRAGIVCLRFAGAERARHELLRRGFVCSHRRGLRIAPHFYNTTDEINRLMLVLQEVAALGAA